MKKNLVQFCLFVMLILITGCSVGTNTEKPAGKPAETNGLTCTFKEWNIGGVWTLKIKNTTNNKIVKHIGIKVTTYAKSNRTEPLAYSAEFSNDINPLQEVVFNVKAEKIYTGDTDVEIFAVSTIDNTTKPIITLRGSQNLDVFVSKFYEDAGADVNDAVFGKIPESKIVKTYFKDGVQVKVDKTAGGDIPFRTEGILEIKFNVANDSGIKADEVIRTLHIIKDTEKPVIKLIGTTCVSISVGIPYYDEGATATDNAESGELLGLKTTIYKNNITCSAIDTTIPGEYIIKYNIKDYAGNMADEVIRTVQVKQIAISQVSAGNRHSMILKEEDSSLWMSGYNQYGQLGVWPSSVTPKTLIFTKPIRVMDNVSSFSAGGNHTMIIKKDNTLWAMGESDYGQLGDGNYIKFTSSPELIMSDVESVSAGTNHTMIVKKDGTLWATGYNSHGQLGDSTTKNKYTPINIMSDVLMVSAGSAHTMIVKKDGTLWATGYNSSGQLGDGTSISKSSPVKIMDDVAFVSAGAEHTMIIKKDGTLWATGENYYGELGDGTIINKLKPVKIMDDVSSASAGNMQTMIIKKDGTLWAAGGNVGDGSAESNPTPVKIMDNVSKVSVGGGYTLIIKNDKSLWGVGNNASGQLGMGTTVYKVTPEPIIF